VIFILIFLPVFVQNATTGINTVLMSVPLKETDAILATDHTYPACRIACGHKATRNSKRTNPWHIFIHHNNSFEYQLVIFIIRKCGN